MERFHRIFFLLFLLGGILLSGCRTSDPDFSPHVVRMYLEESEHLPVTHIVEMILPISGTHITVRARPAFGEWDVTNATHVETEFGPALILLFNSEAARDFYRTTISNQGRRLVLTINGVPIAAHFIDRPIEDGRIFFFLELPDEEVPGIARHIQKTSAELAKRQRGVRSTW